MAEENQKDKSPDRDEEKGEKTPLRPAERDSAGQGKKEEKKESTPQEKEEATESSTGKSGWWKACAIIGVIVVVLLIGYFGLAWILRTLDKNTPETLETASSSSTSSTTSSSAGKAGSTSLASSGLVSTWETECLIPDANSPWAEKHIFTFNADGTAKHVRWSGDSCAGLKEDQPQNYKVTIPANGQINLISTDSGPSIYDSYSLSGNTLKFGHGFCNCSNTAGGKSGGSEGDRIVVINNYLEYHKTK